MKPWKDRKFFNKGGKKERIWHVFIIIKIMIENAREFLRYNFNVQFLSQTKLILGLKGNWFDPYDLQIKQ